MVLGLYEQAIEEHQRELTLSERIGETIEVAISHRKLGECLCELQDFQQALFHQEEYLLVRFCGGFWIRFGLGVGCRGIS